MRSIITVENKQRTEFDLSNLQINSVFHRIHIHCVYNLSDSEELSLLTQKYEDNTLVIAWQPVEVGTWDQDWIDTVNAWAESGNFKFIFLTGAGHRAVISEYLDIKFEVYNFPVFDVRAGDIWRLSNETLQPKTKSFTFINRKDAVHRRYILSCLHNNGLLGQGNVSFQQSDGDVFEQMHDLTVNVGYTDAEVDLIKQCQTQVPELPLLLDNGNSANNLPRSVFGTFVLIAGETHFTQPLYSWQQSFVTEKSFASIANKQILFVVGHTYSLELVKLMGYKTFDSIIDESYDTIIEPGKRLQAVSGEIIKFLNRPREQIEADYNTVRDILDYNYELLFKQTLSEKLQKLIDLL